jgi:hypothetical protein
LIARDVRLRVVLPRGASRDQGVFAIASSSNARPATITDTLPIRSETPIRLRYRPRTAVVMLATRAGFVPRAFETRVQTGNRVWDVNLGDIEPSFSQIAYAEFEVHVDRGG